MQGFLSQTFACICITVITVHKEHLLLVQKRQAAVVLQYWVASSPPLVTTCPAHTDDEYAT